MESHKDNLKDVNEVPDSDSDNLEIDESSQDLNKSNNSKENKNQSSINDNDNGNGLNDKEMQRIGKEIRKQFDKNDKMKSYNVDQIVEQIVSNKLFLAALRKSSPKKVNIEFESLLTRSKAKELKKTLLPPPIIINKNLENSKNESEIHILFNEKLDEDEDDEEYVPNESEFDEECDLSVASDWESVRTRTPSINQSPAHSLIYSNDCSTQTDDLCFKVPVIKDKLKKTPDKGKFLNKLKTPTKNMEKENGNDNSTTNIALRTRSKLSLNDTPLELIEQSLVPPDITTDMYETVCDDEDWSNFLKEFTQPLKNIVKNDGQDDEDDLIADPEYKILADEANQIDKDLRADSHFRVPKTELMDLYTQLLEDYDGHISPPPCLLDELTISNSKVEYVSNNNPLNYYNDFLNYATSKPHSFDSINSKQPVSNVVNNCFSQNLSDKLSSFSDKLQHFNLSPGKNIEQHLPDELLNLNSSGFCQGCKSPLKLNEMKSLDVENNKLVEQQQTINKDLIESLDSHEILNVQNKEAGNEDKQVKILNDVTLNSDERLKISDKNDKDNNKRIKFNIISKNNDPYRKKNTTKQLDSSLNVTIENDDDNNEYLNKLNENLNKLRRNKINENDDCNEECDTTDVLKIRIASKMVNQIKPQNFKNSIPYNRLDIKMNVKGNFFLEQNRVMLINQQLKQHVQLLTTHYILSSSHNEYENIASNYEEWLNEINEILKKNHNNCLNVTNLPLALDTVQKWKLKIKNNKDPEIQAMKEYQKREIDTFNKYLKKKFYNQEFPELIIKTFAVNKVFLYPFLLPKSPLVPILCNQINKQFLSSEYELIVCGINSYMKSSAYKNYYENASKSDFYTTLNNFIRRTVMPHAKSTRIVANIKKAKTSVFSNVIKEFFQNFRHPSLYYYVYAENILKFPQAYEPYELTTPWRNYFYPDFNKKKYVNYNFRVPIPIRSKRLKDYDNFTEILHSSVRQHGEGKRVSTCTNLNYSTSDCSSISSIRAKTPQCGSNFGLNSIPLAVSTPSNKSRQFKNNFEKAKTGSTIVSNANSNVYVPVLLNTINNIPTLNYVPLNQLTTINSCSLTNLTNVNNQLVNQPVNLTNLNNQSINFTNQNGQFVNLNNSIIQPVASNFTQLNQFNPNHHFIPIVNTTSNIPITNPNFHLGKQSTSFQQPIRVVPTSNNSTNWNNILNESRLSSPKSPRVVSTIDLTLSDDDEKPNILNKSFEPSKKRARIDVDRCKNILPLDLNLKKIKNIYTNGKHGTVLIEVPAGEMFSTKPIEDILDERFLNIDENEKINDLEVGSILSDSCKNVDSGFETASKNTGISQSVEQNEKQDIVEENSDCEKPKKPLSPLEKSLVNDDKLKTVSRPSLKRKIKERKCRQTNHPLHHKLSRKDLKVLSSDPDESDTEATYIAHAYFHKVRDRLSSDSDECRSFIQALSDYEESSDTVNDLYNKISTILGSEHQDLIDEFLLVLSPENAQSIGRLADYFKQSDMEQFLKKISKYFTKPKTGVVKKIITTLMELSLKKDITMDELKSVILPMLKGNQVLIDSFLQIFPDEPPPESLMTTFENVKVNESEIDSNKEVFENIIIPDEKDNYGTNNCICNCHSQQSSDDEIKNRIKHCHSCQIKFINGRIYIHTGRTGLRPASVTFQNGTLSDHIKRLSPPLSLATTRHLPRSKRRSESSPLKQISTNKNNHSETSEDETTTDQQKLKSSPKSSTNKLTPQISNAKNCSKPKKLVTTQPSKVKNQMNSPPPLKNDVKQKNKLDSNSACRNLKDIDKFLDENKSNETMMETSETDVFVNVKETLDLSSDSSLNDTELTTKGQLKSAKLKHSVEELDDFSKKDSSCLINESKTVLFDSSIKKFVVESTRENDLEKNENILSEKSNDLSKDLLLKVTAEAKSKDAWTKAEDKMILDTCQKESAIRQAFIKLHSTMPHRAIDEIENRFNYLLRMYMEVENKFSSS